MSRARAGSGRIRPASPRGKKKTRLRTAAASAAAPPLPSAPPEEITVPTRWVKAFIGISLLPLCWVTTAAFFSLLANSAPGGAFWRTEQFWFFALGAILWGIAFLGLPKPIMLYVLGHELTHLIWAAAMGARITHIQAGAEGGHVITDRNNFLIALAPYFFPIYSIIVLALLGLLKHWGDPLILRCALLTLLGASWSFHVTFTLWMIPRRQTDIIEHGTLFSLAIIYLANILVLSAFLALTSPGVTMSDFGREWVSQTAAWSEWLVGILGPG